MKARLTLVGAAICSALVACDQPAEPDPPAIDVAYLLDRVNGAPPPAPVCEQGSVDQTLRFESISLLEDGTYGRAQRIQIESDPPIDQEERGDFVRTDSTILLINALDDTLTLTLLGDTDSLVRRIHTCGDTLRYASVPIVEE